MFVIALGLAGLGSALRFAGLALEEARLLSAGYSILIFAGIVLVIDVLIYLGKVFRVRGHVVQDLTMATSANMLAPGFMVATVIGGVSASEWDGGSYLWLAGSIGHLILLVGFVGRWLQRDYKPEALNPTWFMPAAGIMTSAMAWPGFGPIELPMFTLTVGGVLWFTLLPLIFRRLVLEPAVEPKLRPTLFIIAAPFGLMAGGLLTLFPSLPRVVPELILAGGTFFILVLLTSVPFLHKAGATLAWWSPTFPVATVASGYLRIGGDLNSITMIAGLTLLVIACVTTSLAVLATIHVAWLAIFATNEDPPPASDVTPKPN
ncbi:MAG: hypothetical protein AAF638_11610 [Pseudomonadota bacterium]